MPAVTPGLSLCKFHIIVVCLFMESQTTEGCKLPISKLEIQVRLSLIQNSLLSKQTETFISQSLKAPPAELFGCENKSSNIIFYSGFITQSSS